MKDPVACVNCASLLFQFRMAFASWTLTEAGEVTGFKASGVRADVSRKHQGA
jgi:hypothetical protein